MAYIKGYTYDIFISYAHVDNNLTSWENLGWIEKFYKDLDALLTRRIGRPGVIKIWWDKRKLDGSVLFDNSIEEGIKKSAILICLNSPSYIGSDYCKKELDLFYSKAKQEPLGLEIANRSRLLNVLLYNIPFNEWPPKLSGTSGFAFHDAKEADDYGDPLDTRSPEYSNQLQNLRDAVMKLLTNFPKEETHPIVQPNLKEEKKSQEDFIIYMAEVADTLRPIRKRTVLELKKKAIVLYLMFRRRTKLVLMNKE
jgi:hypothetical protein